MSAKPNYRHGVLISAALLFCSVGLPGVAAQDSQKKQEAVQESHRKTPQRQSESAESVRIYGVTIPNDVIEDLLVIRLAERNFVPGIKVKVNDGIAILSGQVTSAEAKRRAVHIARATPGIFGVEDRLAIVEPAGKATAEKLPAEKGKLAQQVAQRIAANITGAKAGADWWFDGWRVEGPYNRWNLIVEADDSGRVTLEGEVPTLDIMRKAVETAAAVPAVRSLDSDLELETDFYGYRYPYGYPYYPPYALAPQPWYPPDSAQRETQSGAGAEQQAEKAR